MGSILSIKTKWNAENFCLKLEKASQTKSRLSKNTIKGPSSHLIFLYCTVRNALKILQYKR